MGKVIINKVDVSDCKFLFRHLGDSLCSDKCDSYCNWHPNCEYKTYMREKQKSKILLEPTLYEGQTILYQDKEYYVKHLNRITENEIDVTLHEIKR